MGTYLNIVFRERSPSGKTNIFDVRTKQHCMLGEVRWYSRWRKYSFFPADGCIFEQVCLREIAGFIESQTLRHGAGS